jgi:hypothetical protein
MKIVLILLMLAVTVTGFGQTAKPELISSSGGSFVSSNQQITWSLGEAIIESFTNGNTGLSQGFHQCSYLITAVDETVVPAIAIKVFPNPVSDFVNVQIAENDQLMGNYVITLTDLLGKQLDKFKPTTNCTKVNLRTFVAGTYFLSVSGSAKTIKTIKTFKIIKSE